MHVNIWIISIYISKCFPLCECNIPFCRTVMLFPCFHHFWCCHGMHSSIVECIPWILHVAFLAKKGMPLLLYQLTPTNNNCYLTPTVTTSLQTLGFIMFTKVCPSAKWYLIVILILISLIISLAKHFFQIIIEISL